MNPPIRVLLVDDQSLFRAAIKVMMRSSSSRSRILSIACSSNDGVALVERRSALGHHSFDGSKPVA